LGGDEAVRALADHTTLRVGGEAALVIRCRGLDCLSGWWRLARDADLPVIVLGRGSNVLASDDGFAGLVLLNRCEAWEVDASSPAQPFVLAEGGVTLAALAVALCRLGWSGLEAAAGIPGSVGAAVVTNAGAHGWEMADSLLWAEITDQSGTRRATPDELAFRYRGSALKGRRDVLVLRAALALKADDVEAISARVSEFQRHRKATQPNNPSVGSMFKNPPGDYAGRLLEEAGLKGMRAGGAAISEVHANFFINTGEATEADVRELVARARHAVRDRFDLELELEIETLGTGATDAS
jgi:UDP-N-acetylmuramate dehydrogenase